MTADWATWKKNLTAHLPVFAIFLSNKLHSINRSQLKISKGESETGEGSREREREI